MRVDIERVGRVLVVRLAGELDHHTASHVRKQIDEEWGKGIDSYLVLNLAGIGFMDSSGLGVIIGRYKRVVESGGKMFVSNLSEPIKKLMDMSGLFKILTSFPDEKQALSACEVAS